jgi:hypothetical protein
VVISEGSDMPWKRNQMPPGQPPTAAGTSGTTTDNNREEKMEEKGEGSKPEQEATISWPRSREPWAGPRARRSSIVRYRGTPLGKERPTLRSNSGANRPRLVCSRTTLAPYVLHARIGR